MSGKMKALVKSRKEEGLWLEEVTVPEVGVNDVLIRIHKTAICGTDLHIYNWDDWAQKTIPIPMVVGHEFVGTVAAVGSNVTSFSEGEIVSGEGHIVCGHCRNCLAGRRHLCINTQGIGVNRPGAFAEYLCIPAVNVWPAHPKIDMEQLSYFDPLGNAVHTVLTFDLIGEDVLITGAGPIGLMAIPVCKHVGAKHVVITDVNPYRLDIARRMGASRVVDVRREKLTDITEELSMTEGFDVGLEMSGSPTALREMLHAVRHGGKIALLGIQPPNTAIDWNDVIFKSLRIQGVYGRKMFETWYKMQAMLLSGLDVTGVVTHRFEVDDFKKGFDVMRSGECGKVILNWVD